MFFRLFDERQEIATAFEETSRSLAFFMCCLNSCGEYSKKEAVKLQKGSSKKLTHPARFCILRNHCTGGSMTEYTILLTWDDEARVWVAENDDIPIALEAGSFDGLIERVRYAVPEILSENGKPADVYLNFITHRRAKVYA
jgi:hypothetical protein